MKLENWSITRLPVSAYQAPESGPPCFTGQVFGHPKFPEGDNIVSTPIKRIFEGGILTESGSVYHLGEPAPAYEAQFPNAKARLLASLEKGEGV